MSTWKTTHDVEEHEISVGNDLWLISGTLMIGWFHDANADCDADGNRGHEVTAEDERDWTLLTASRCGADGEWEPNADPIPADVIAVAEKWVETYEPNDYGESPEDEEPDYDPIEEEDRRERRFAQSYEED